MTETLERLLREVTRLENRSEGLTNFFENNRFLLCVFLKAAALNKEQMSKKMCISVENILSKLSIEKTITIIPKHPSQRLAYWYVKAVENLISISDMKPENNKISACINFLLRIRNNKDPDNTTLFDRNVMGVMLACELLDLKENGDYQELKDFDAHAFLQQVLDNKETVDSTREWVDNNYPDEEDWLKPLKFNYR